MNSFFDARKTPLLSGLAQLVLALHVKGTFAHAIVVEHRHDIQQAVFLPANRSCNHH